MNSKEFRKSFIDYFTARGHANIPSSSLIPLDDPTLLFTNAGMNQFKDYLLGKEERYYKRACNVQKCIRAGGKHNDLDSVGRDSRHATFFEMLGNWSFGDYYKKEAIEFAWEYLTKILKLPEKKLYASIYKDDDESYTIWKKNVGLNDEKIVRLGNISRGDEENFWSMGETGPCGFCSEIYIDRGEEFSCGKPNCGVGCDCDRFLEFWNLVFMEFNRDSKGSLSPLPKKNVDTGMGLDRVSLILQNKRSIFTTDLLWPLILQISELSGKGYNDRDFSVSMNVISDHARCLTFALSDGATFSNEGRGYVLRRILRRAIRHGKNLGLNDPFLFKLTPSVVNIMGETYPEIAFKESVTAEMIRIEEQKFFLTLERGLEIFNREVSRIKSKGDAIINGQTAFLLYDTYGFPLDLTEIIAVEQNLTIDKIGFDEEMEKQRKKARDTMKFFSEEKNKWEWIILNEGESLFTGYETCEANSRILRYRESGENIDIILDKTPFYAEMGGQVGDTGFLKARESELDVIATIPNDFGNQHITRLKKGSLKDFIEGEIIATIDVDRRRSIMRNHTATHLLQSALRLKLGDQIHQAGSYVDDTGFRFDFNYHRAVDEKILFEIEKIVNDNIMENITVKILNDVPVNEAKKMGAMAIFGEKYGEKVRVVRIGDFINADISDVNTDGQNKADRGYTALTSEAYLQYAAARKQGSNEDMRNYVRLFSVELCGGTHANSTGEIGSFVVTRESSIASGVRRIEATTGSSALLKSRNDDSILKELENLLTTSRNELLSKIEKMLAEKRELQKKLKEKSGNTLAVEIDKYLDRAKIIQDHKIIIESVNVADKSELLNLADLLRARIPSGAAILVSSIDDKTPVYIVVTKNLSEKGILDASLLMKELFKICDGSGGGKPHLAQGGLKNNNDIEKFMKSAEEIITRMIA